MVLLNGGLGSRVAAGRPKQLLRVNGIPILVYSLVAADAVEEITQDRARLSRRMARRGRKSRQRLRHPDPITYVPAGRTPPRVGCPNVGACRHDNVADPRVGPPASDGERLREAHRVGARRGRVTCSRSRSPSRRWIPRRVEITGSLDRYTVRATSSCRGSSAKATLVAAHRYAADNGLLLHGGRDPVRRGRIRHPVPRRPPNSTSRSQRTQTFSSPGSWSVARQTMTRSVIDHRRVAQGIGQCDGRGRFFLADNDVDRSHPGRARDTPAFEAAVEKLTADNPFGKRRPPLRRRSGRPRARGGL